MGYEELIEGRRVRLAVRLAFGLVMVSSLAFLGSSMTSGTVGDDSVTQPFIPDHVNGFTAITVHGPSEKSKLVVYGPDGQIAYVNSTYDRYYDVDPSSAGAMTLEYVGAEHVFGPPCAAGASCSLNVVERVNLTTGETERVYARYTPGIHNSRWHDVDRVDDHRLVIAGIDRDRVFMVNTTTGMIEWQWEAQSFFPLESGGIYPPGAQGQGDWTHINDVEVTEQGWVMASIRNQDRIVFIDPRTGVVERYTLGAEDDYSIIYEQHNPDYIPAANGGPALLVADSHNNRIIEFQRIDGEWVQSWEWEDARARWTRDADRLPNGNTLITDSGGDRVLEIDQDGEILWSVEIDTPYEAERLGTGDESAGGMSAQALGLQSRTLAEGPSADDGRRDPISPNSVVRTFWTTVRNLLPSKLTNAVLFVLPPWIRFAELTAIGVLLLGTVSWTYLEYRWSPYQVSFRRPISVNRTRR